MTTHYVQHPTTKQIYHFGRKRPALRPKRMFSKYRLPGSILPTAPSVVDYWTGCAALSDILANDVLGCCTSSGALHVTESLTYAAGAPVTLTRDDAIKFYSISAGYVTGDPSTDQGGDEVQVLNTWRDKGLDGSGAHAIAGWLDVDPTNQAEMRALTFMGCSLYFGVDLPDAWTSVIPRSNGYVWTPGAPDPNQGHCFVGIGANDQGIQVDSWGLIGTITYDAIASLCSEASGGALYAVLTKESLVKATQMVPAGIDWQCLVAEFDSEGGTVSS